MSIGCDKIKMTSNKLRIQSGISDKELETVSQLIYQRAGIVLSVQKRDMVYNRLSRRLRDLGISTFSEYLNDLKTNPNSNEWQSFINALTTNLTSFFRESYHFPILAEHARQRKAGYKIWCTAASTGEEPISAAITLNETLGKSMSGPRIWATDIDTEVLSKGMAGVYRLSDIDNLSAEQKRNYFMRGTGTQENRVKVRKELLDSIHYEQLNLLSSNWDVPAPFDAIFCRNVMIYFDQKTQEHLLKRFASLLKPGGLLFTGHSEHFGPMNGAFRLLGQSVYVLSQEK